MTASSCEITVDFHPAHLNGIAPILRESDAADFRTCPDPLQAAKLLADNGIAWTVSHAGYVLVCGGIVQLWPGVGEWWSLTTIYADQYPKQFHRAAKDMIERGRTELALHRLQAAVRATNERAIRWHERLGFLHEGLMAAYGADGADYVRMAKLCHS